MILRSDAIVQRLHAPASERLMIVPLQQPEDQLARSLSGAVDLRLGCWFLTFRREGVPHLDYSDPSAQPADLKVAKRVYVPIGGRFVLHPRSFVLGVTMEWIRLPGDLVGSVVGKSSWGRRGLIIATATGVHPWFCGCLTLELANVGELPISISPNAEICQLFLSRAETAGDGAAPPSRFAGRRQPVVGGRSK